MTDSIAQHLVEPDWLAEHLDDPSVRVLDVTAKLTSALDNAGGAEVWSAAHIPGSVHYDVGSGHGVLSDPDAPLPWTWPTPERIADGLRRAGVGDGDRVVIVGRTVRPGIDAGTMWCTRAWWTLHHSGIDVAILRGGIERWEAEGRPLVATPTEVEPGDVVPVDGRAAACASKDDVLAAVRTGSACVLDALPASSYDGSGTGYGPRRGHITGALNLPFLDLIDEETAGFPDLDELRARLDARGLLDRDRIITYCGGAIAATVPAFALALVGHGDVAVYEGSLVEWAADPSLPMTGPG